MTTRLRLRHLPTASMLLALSLAACGGSAGSTTAPAATTSATTAPSSSANGSPGPGGSATAKVNANTASEAEIAAALTAAGVPNGDRWAREVTEYRPYPTDDPTLQKLQDNLAKYNPDPATLAGILSVLVP